MHHVVVAGGGLAALRAAESLRRDGFAGLITAVAAEAHPPYTRPPLSKAALTTGADATSLAFRTRLHGTDVDWRLGLSAVGADLAAQALTLSNGSTLHYDGLVIATGLRARRLTPTIATAHVLRVVEDARRLRGSIAPGQRMVVIGSGFVGCEAAAIARAAGMTVTVVSLDSVPMAGAVGDLLGTEIREHHEASGVRFILGVGIEEVDTGARITLSNGDCVQADVIVEAVGSTPNIEWLNGSGIDATDGVLVDNAMRVIDEAGNPLDGVHAAGDVARYPNPLFDDVPRRVEHWTNATDTGRRAGTALAHYLRGHAYADTLADAFTPTPFFWSDQGTLRLQSHGLPAISDRAQRIATDAPRGFAVAYTRAGELVGVAGHNAAEPLATLARDIRRPSLPPARDAVVQRRFE
jgi:3-phenylpropionate/trans-cinnamate dioxygenase ferredoxin reductase subunit